MSVPYESPISIAFSIAGQLAPIFQWCPSASRFDCPVRLNTLSKRSPPLSSRFGREWRAARMLNFHIRWNRTHVDYGIIPFVHEQLLSVFRSGEVDVAVQSLTSHIENWELIGLRLRNGIQVARNEYNAPRNASLDNRSISVRCLDGRRDAGGSTQPSASSMAERCPFPPRFGKLLPVFF